MDLKECMYVFEKHAIKPLELKSKNNATDYWHEDFYITRYNEYTSGSYTIVLNMDKEEEVIVIDVYDGNQYYVDSIYYPNRDTLLELCDATSTF